VRLARHRRIKVACSPSYANFTFRVNAAMLLDLDHTLRGQHIREEWGQVGNPNLKVFDVPTVEELIE
jgi:hypothetical protein